MSYVYKKKYGSREVVLLESQYKIMKKRLKPKLTRVEKKRKLRDMGCPTCNIQGLLLECKGCTFKKFSTKLDVYGCMALTRETLPGGSFHLRFNAGWIGWFDEKQARKELKILYNELMTFKKEVRK